MSIDRVCGSQRVKTQIILELEFHFQAAHRIGSVGFCFSTVNAIFNFCRLVTESVHWYLTKEKYDDLARTVKDISRANNKQLTELTQYNLDMLMAKGEKASAYLFYLTSFIGLSKGV